MRTPSVLTALILISLPAAAQSGGPLETELDFEWVTALYPISDHDADTEKAEILGELSLIGQTQKVLENGVRLRARGALRIQRDNPARPGGIGGFGGDVFAPVGAFSGYSSAQPLDDSDMRGRLETAYLQIDGGYGEVRLGKDRGVADRFHEGTKSVLSQARLDSTFLDPSGLATVRSRHNLTGPSAKLSYATPRLVGVRAGFSFTPNADADGLDRRPAAGTGGTAPETENAVEFALNATRRFRDSGFRVDLGLGWSSADVSANGLTAQYDTVESWSAGTRIEKDDWTIGTSWLTSDNGLPNSDYSAWSAGLHRDLYNTEFSAEYGQSEDDGAALDTNSWRIGAAREFGPSAKLAIAYLDDEIESPLHNWRSQGVVVEITLSQEIVRLTGN